MLFHKELLLETEARKYLFSDTNTLSKLHSANSLRRLNLQTLFNNTSIFPFKWRGKYLCFYCGEASETYEKLAIHTEEHGQCSETDKAMQFIKAADIEVKVDISNITCKLCKESFADLETIITHLVTKHNLLFNKNVELSIAPYRLVDLKCLWCDEKFTYFGKLISHVNCEHPSQSISCVKCGQKFNKKRDLDTHNRSKHRNMYTCLKCSRNFLTSSDLISHKRKWHPSKCNICFKTFLSMKKCLEHIENDHVSTEYKCGFCFYSSTAKKCFIEHLSECTDNIKTFTENKDIVNKKLTVKQIRNNMACIFNMSTAMPFKYFMSRFRCFYCIKDFHECDDLKHHTMMEHPLCDTKLKSMKLRHRQDGFVKVDISTLSCKICFEKLQDLNKLIEHLNIEHKIRCDISAIANLQAYKLIKDNFACPFCVQIFGYFRSLLYHIGKSHSDNKNICVHCGLAFRNSPNLRAHISRHHKLANFKCTACDMRFFTNNYLQTHLGRAHGTKIVKCHECKERFKSTYEMQRHKIKTHGSGHECSYCHKLFTGKSAVNNHIRRTHLKEKNVECKACHERFFNSQSLKQHMIKHYGERNYHCDVCGKKFLWKKNLRGHMSSHTKKTDNKIQL